MFRNKSTEKRQPAHANTKKLHNMFRVNREKDNLLMLIQKTL